MRWRMYAAIVLLAVLTPYTYMLRFGTVETTGTPKLAQIPLSVGGFLGSDEPIGLGTLQVLGADETILRVYQRSGRPRIWLFLSYFAAAQENSQIHSPKHCYPGSGWNIYDEGTQEIELAGKRTSIKRLYITDGANRRVVLYWFATRSGLIADEFGLKWDQMKNSLLRRSQSTAFTRFSAEVGAGEREGDVLVELLDFIRAISPQIQAALKGAFGGSNGINEGSGAGG